MRREEKERNATSLLGSLVLDIDIHPVHLPQLRPASPAWRDWPIVQVASVRQLLSGLRALSLSSSRPQQSGHQSLTQPLSRRAGWRARQSTNREQPRPGVARLRNPPRPPRAEVRSGEREGSKEGREEAADRARPLRLSSLVASTVSHLMCSVRLARVVPPFPHWQLAREEPECSIG